MSPGGGRRAIGQRPVALAFAAAVVAAASHGCSETPAADARTVKMGQSGGTTYVSITEPSNVKVNAECVRYCERLADCWYAVSTGNIALTRDEVKERCRSEEGDCRTKTKTSYCCGKLRDCLEFSECHGRSNDAPGDCSGSGNG